MKKLIVAALVAIAGVAWADDQKQFCEGFEEGYKLVKGDNVMVPMCPMAPMTPMGSTPRREGIKAGMAAAKR